MKTLEERRDVAMDAIDKLYNRKAGLVKRAKAEAHAGTRRGLWLKVERISNQILAAAKTADALCKAAPK